MGLAMKVDVAPEKASRTMPQCRRAVLIDLFTRRLFGSRIANSAFCSE
jgi:hypothetical protein